MTTDTRRRPRSAFTQVLIKICERLDAAAPTDITFSMPIFGRVTSRQVQVASLWVVGSYAKGASACGDLDLVVNFAHLGNDGPRLSSAIARLAGRYPDVRWYQGTPARNSSGVAFTGAILLRAPGHDWRAALAGIKEDPAYVREERITDQIPVRQEQVNLRPDQFKKLADLESRGILTWTFEALDPNDEDSPFEPQQDETNLVRNAQRNWNAKACNQLPSLLRYLRNTHAHGTIDRFMLDGTHFRAGGLQVIVGRPSVAVALLDLPNCSRLVIAPTPSRRGPNGIWVIRRGAAHPVSLLFHDVGAYVLIDQVGRPVFIHDSVDHYEYQTLEVFRSVTAGAADRLNEARRREPARHFELAHLKGDALLQMLSSADSLDIETAPGFMVRALLSRLAIVAVGLELRLAGSAQPSGEPVQAVSAEQLRDLLVE